MRNTVSLSQHQRTAPSVARLVCSAVLCAALVSAGCRKAETPKPAPAAPAPEPQVEKAPAEAVQSLADLATEYEALQQQADQTNKKVVDALSKYQKRGGKLPPNFGPDLTDEQRQMLVERIQQERSGTRTLLQDIIDKDKQIKDLRGRMGEMNAKLPDHATAKDGDRHDRIAMNYLMSKGVSAQKAFEIVSQMNLEDALVPGFTVWNFYSNGQFGTWVTRGSATITPQEHQKRLAKLLEDERDQAQKVAAALKTQVDLLSKDQQKLKADAKSASDEAAALLDMLAREKEKADAERRTREAAANTVKYSLGAKNQLQKMKVIDGRLKLISLDQADMFSINTAEKTTIAIDASSFGLKKIKKITIVPEVFVPGKDYQIQQDGLFATIRMISLEKFKRNQFVIVVE